MILNVELFDSIRNVDMFFFKVYECESHTEYRLASELTR